MILRHRGKRSRNGKFAGRSTESEKSRNDKVAVRRTGNKSHGMGGSQVDVQNIQRQESGITQAEEKSTKSLQNKKSLNIKIQSTEATI